MIGKQDLKKAVQFACFWVGAAIVVLMGLGSALLVVMTLFPLHDKLSGWTMAGRLVIAVVLLMVSLISGHLLNKISGKYSGIEEL